MTDYVAENLYFFCNGNIRYSFKINMTLNVQILKQTKQTIDIIDTTNVSVFFYVEHTKY